MPDERNIDLGEGHSYRFFRWSPERDINPQYDGIPDIERAGALVTHINKKDGTECESGIFFDEPDVRKVFTNPRSWWQVQSYEPLTLSPSILCMRCGDHGFIRNGKWESA